MNVIIFGSTGRTGKYLIESALENGMEVTAFARNPDRILYRHSRLRVFQGDATNPTAVDAAMAGQDAVVFAVGTDLGRTNLRQTAMQNIISAMQKHHVRRIVGIGGMGILQASAEKMVFQTEGFPAEYIPVSEDHFAAFEVLQKSGLDFTFVCPPTITDGPYTGRYVTQEDFPPDGKYVIDTADLADFMIRELREPRFVGKRVGITAI